MSDFLQGPNNTCLIIDKLVSETNLFSFSNLTLFSDTDLFASVLISTAFLMSITRLTSSEAVRSVLSSEHEAGPGLCDSVEAGLAAWEVRVGGLLAQRLGHGAGDWAEQEAWAETRLDRYYTVNTVF